MDTSEAYLLILRWICSSMYHIGFVVFLLILFFVSAYNSADESDRAKERFRSLRPRQLGGYRRLRSR